MPVRPLPPSPSLVHLRHQAKDLLTLHAQRDPTTAQRLREFHPRFAHASDETIFAAALTLSDAQLTIAREHGFQSWPRLKAEVDKPALANRRDLPHHERITDPLFRQAVALIDQGDGPALKLLLTQHPQLARQRVTFEGANYFQNPALLEFIAENPIRQGRLSPGVVEVTRTILEANPDQPSRDDTLALVATGNIPCASPHLVPLIDLLCQHGADPFAALQAAVLHGEPASVRALLARGIPVTLSVASAFDLREDFTRLLATSTPEERHLAMALSAQYGTVEIMRQLLAAGEDPNRFNPVGGHSHGTPLHHAAGFGRLDLVCLLVEHGARQELKDVLWHATPLEWAKHEGRTEVAQYLEAQAASHP